MVQAYLYAGQSIDTLLVTQSNSYSSTDSLTTTLEGLDIQISDGQNTYNLVDNGDGWYAQPDILIESEQTYFLSFEYNGAAVSSETFVPAKREATISENEIFMEKIEAGTFPNFGDLPEPITISWDNSEGDYYYVLIQNIEESPELINELFGNIPRGFRRISEPQIMDEYSINPIREIQQFGRHQIIIFRVMPEYAALYGTSGSTSTSIVEPPTNIENGLGIFTGVSSDTLILNVKEQ